MFDVKKIRKDFPILKRKIHGKKLVYLDNAATSQKPKQVIQAIKDFYEKHNANIHRGVYVLSEESSQMYEDAYEKVAKFINADGMEEIVLVRNTNEAVNIILYSWAWNNLKKGDEIITTMMEHHANIVPWQMLQKKGVKLKFVDINDNGTLKMEEFDKLVTNKTKLVAVVHVSNVVGTINPIKKIGKMAHDHDAKLLVDAAQSVPHMPVDVKEIDCDFLAFSGHKMLAPTGTGALFVKKEILENMQPFMRGSAMIKEVYLHEAKWNDLPWRFEAGTPSIADNIAFATAIDYLKKIGMRNVREHEKQLTKYALKRMGEIKQLKIYGPLDADKRGGVIAFTLGDIHPHDLSTVLDDFGIATRSGHHCAMPLHNRLKLAASTRASFYIYNTKEEIDYFIDALNKAAKVFRL